MLKYSRGFLIGCIWLKCLILDASSEMGDVSSGPGGDPSSMLTQIFANTDDHEIAGCSRVVLDSGVLDAVGVFIPFPGGVKVPAYQRYGRLNGAQTDVFEALFDHLMREVAGSEPAAPDLPQLDLLRSQYGDLLSGLLDDTSDDFAEKKELATRLLMQEYQDEANIIAAKAAVYGRLTGEGDYSKVLMTVYPKGVFVFCLNKSGRLDLDPLSGFLNAVASAEEGSDLHQVRKIIELASQGIKGKKSKKPMAASESETPPLMNSDLPWYERVPSTRLKERKEEAQRPIIGAIGGDQHIRDFKDLPSLLAALNNLLSEALLNDAMSYQKWKQEHQTTGMHQ